MSTFFYNCQLDFYFNIVYLYYFHFTYKLTYFISNIVSMLIIFYMKNVKIYVKMQINTFLDLLIATYCFITRLSLFESYILSQLHLKLIVIHYCSAPVTVIKHVTAFKTSIYVVHYCLLLMSCVKFFQGVFYSPHFGNAFLNGIFFRRNRFHKCVKIDEPCFLVLLVRHIVLQYKAPYVGTVTYFYGYYCLLYLIALYFDA